MNDEECFLALNLLRGILRFKPEDRPTATKILDHALLSRKYCSANLLESDVIWIEESSSVDLFNVAVQYSDQVNFKENAESQENIVDPSIVPAVTQDTVPDGEMSSLNDTTDVKLPDVESLYQFYLLNSYLWNFSCKKFN